MADSLDHPHQPIDAHVTSPIQTDVNAEQVLLQVAQLDIPVTSLRDRLLARMAKYGSGPIYKQLLQLVEERILLDGGETPLTGAELLNVIPVCAVRHGQQFPEPATIVPTEDTLRFYTESGDYSFDSLVQGRNSGVYFASAAWEHIRDASTHIQAAQAGAIMNGSVPEELHIQTHAIEKEKPTPTLFTQVADAMEPLIDAAIQYDTMYCEGSSVDNFAYCIPLGTDVTIFLRHVDNYMIKRLNKLLANVPNEGNHEENSYIKGLSVGKRELNSGLHRYIDLCNKILTGKIRQGVDGYALPEQLNDIPLLKKRIRRFIVAMNPFGKDPTYPGEHDLLFMIELLPE